MSASFNRQRLRLDVTGNESMRFENDILTADGPLDLAVDNHPLSLNGTVDERLG
jgi:hypothetical protein